MLDGALPVLRLDHGDGAADRTDPHLVNTLADVLADAAQYCSPTTGGASPPNPRGMRALAGLAENAPVILGNSAQEAGHVRPWEQSRRPTSVVRQSVRICALGGYQ